MATAICKRTFVTKTRVVEERVDVPAGVDLYLTHREAQVLSLILEAVGGHPVTSARRHSNSIHLALNAAGYNADDVRAHLDLLGLNKWTCLKEGSITFIRDLPDSTP